MTALERRIGMALYGALCIKSKGKLKHKKLTEDKVGKLPISDEELNCPNGEACKFYDDIARQGYKAYEDMKKEKQK